MTAGLGNCFACAALGTIDLIVARYVDFQKRTRGDCEFESSTAAVNQSTRGDNAAARLFYNAHRLARRAPSSPHIFDYKHLLRWLQGKPATKSHSPGGISFDKNRPNPKSPGNLVTYKNASQSGRNDAIDRAFAELISQGAAQALSQVRVLKHKSALDIGRAVTPTG